MKPVTREEIVSNEDYEAERPALRHRVMGLKNDRRVHLGDHLTFLFENRDTIRYQVQEMLRIEGRSSDEDVEHELRTYNELLGGERELGCTLLIEIEDPDEREQKLGAWIDLPRHLALELEDGSLSRAVFDERQVGDGRLSSVQYLRFDCGGGEPRALVCDLPALSSRVELTPAQRAALGRDLAADAST